jgi:16S rRNA processing protein RimM
MDRATWVPVAQVGRPHGLRGEVRMRMYNRDSRLLEAGMQVLLRSGDAPPRPVELEWVHGGGPGVNLAKVRGIDGPEDAATLRGAVVCVRREAFPDLDGGEFYVCDIVGAKLVGPSGELGTVEGIVSYPGTDVLVVKPKDSAKETVEVPLIDDFVDRVDTEAGTVVAKEGILEFFR